VLYKQGPPFYHASYIVLVEVIDKSTLMRIPGLQRSLTWTRLMGLNRVGESAGKVNRYVYSYFFMHMGIVLYQMMTVHTELLYFLILAICYSAKK